MTKHLFSILATAISAAGTVTAAETWWPQFRGPNGSGVSESAKPPVEFAPGTNQLWKISVPPGLSSPCVWLDWIFLTAFDGGKLERYWWSSWGARFKLLCQLPHRWVHRHNQFTENLQPLHEPTANFCSSRAQRVGCHQVDCFPSGQSFRSAFTALLHAPPRRPRR